MEAVLFGGSGSRKHLQLLLPLPKIQFLNLEKYLSTIYWYRYAYLILNSLSKKNFYHNLKLKISYKKSIFQCGPLSCLQFFFYMHDPILTFVIFIISYRLMHDDIGLSFFKALKKTSIPRKILISVF